MFQIGIFLAMAPFLIFSDYMALFQRMQPHQAELTKASHGAYMMVAGLFCLIMLHDDVMSSNYYLAAVVAMIAFGAFWLYTGAQRVRGFSENRLVVRALFKIGLGVAVWIAYKQGMFAPVDTWRFLAVVVITSWCLVTGITRLVILHLPQQGMSFFPQRVHQETIVPLFGGARVVEGVVAVHDMAIDITPSKRVSKSRWSLVLTRKQWGEFVLGMALAVLGVWSWSSTAWWVALYHEIVPREVTAHIPLNYVQNGIIAISLIAVLVGAWLIEWTLKNRGRQ